MNNPFSPILRLEALALLLASLAAYHHAGFSWALFAWLFFVPDIALIAYLAGNKIGAIAYNLTHSLIGPLLLLAAGFCLQHPLILSCAAIWLAHIGFDRALGFGLKSFTGFGFTHLGVIGKK